MEEVKTADARENVLKQLAAERNTKYERAFESRRRKRPNENQKSKKMIDNKKKSDHSGTNAITVENDEENDDLDDDLLAMVDHERKEERRRKKKMRKLEQRAISKETFRYTNLPEANDEFLSQPSTVSADSNIELVVLGQGKKNVDGKIERDRQALLLSASMGAKPSKAAFLFSKSRLAGSEMDNDNRSSTRKGNKRNKIDGRKEGMTWKRSMKKNIPMKLCGQPALFFKSRT